MKEIWFCSDLHLGHDNMYKFTNYDGSKCRPWDNYIDAEEYMIQEFNKLIKPEDTLYCLGDVASKTDRASYFFDRLNPCRRILIMGNHDNKIGFKFLSKYFNEIRGAYNLENYIMTHIPVSCGSKGRFKRNIHGHTHNNVITVDNDGKIPDVWYKNVCVECTDFKLINFDEIKQETEKLITQGKITIPKRGDRIV
jgi:calcineurin-like phosphoesterase family protein